MKLLNKFIAVFSLLSSSATLADSLEGGYVIGWGADIGGASTGTSYYSTNVVLIKGIPLTNAVAVAGGLSHSLAIRSDGTVIGWGANLGGQITIPSDLSNVTAVAAGPTHSLALKNDGTAVVWGEQRYGQTDMPSDLNNVVAIAAGGEHCLAVKGDGTVASWGSVKMPAGLSNIVMVTASMKWLKYDFALKADGTVLRWYTKSGKAEAVPGLSNVVAIASGISAFSGDHNLALKRDGTVAGWGYVSAVPQGLSNVVAITAGDTHSLALKRDGTLVAWGKIGFQPATVPAGLSNVVAIAAGENYCLAITTNPAVAHKFLSKLSSK